MAYRLKNLSGFPLDVSTMNGPAILPAHGEITVELGALDVAAMEASPYVEISAAAGAKRGRKAAGALEAQQ